MKTIDQQYKESKIEWIGKVPKHWKLGALKHSFKFNVGFTPPTANYEYYSNDGHTWVSISDLNSKYISSSKNQISDIAVEKFSKGIVPKGSLLYSFKLSVGKVAFAAKDIFTNEAIFCVYPDTEKELSYYYYCLPTILIHNANENIYGAKIFNQDVIKNSVLPIPPLPEQTRIANYLDYQTNIIDQLIEKKEKLVTLLQEQRQAIINEAVTKGLDPNAKMKDSGIEWLGDIPDNWELVKIGHYCNVARGGSPRPAGDPKYFNGDYMPWITVAEVTKGNDKYLWETSTFLTEEGSKRSRIIEPETLLLSNSGATLGVPKISKIQGCINDGSLEFTLFKDKLERDFLYYFFKTHTQIYRDEMSGYGQPNLNIDIVKNTIIPLPPVDKQIRIITFIEETQSLFIESSEQLQFQIGLLYEYRQSIISEAVTGKIDLREWKAPKSATA